MQFIWLLALLQPQDWTTNPTILAWISVASLIIGVLGIVAGFALGYWFYQKGKNWHRLVYQVISDTPIVSIKESTGRGKIKVTYEAPLGNTASSVQEINDARLLTLKVWNAGNGDVIVWSTKDRDKANLEEPIEFEFEGRMVVGLTHLETNPPEKVIKQIDFDEYLETPLSTSTCLGLPRCILSTNQYIQLGILLNGPSGNTKLKTGKLLNGEVVNIEEVSKIFYRRIYIISALVLILIAIPAFFILKLIPTPASITISLHLDAILIIILVAFIVGLVDGILLAKPRRSY